MPDYSSLSFGDRLVRCSNEKCQSKQAWHRPVFQFMLVKPASGDEASGVRANQMRTVWYCCHCNSPISFSDPVVNLPLTLNNISGVPR